MGSTPKLHRGVHDPPWSLPRPFVPQQLACALWPPQRHWHGVLGILGSQVLLSMSRDVRADQNGGRDSQGGVWTALDRLCGKGPISITSDGAVVYDGKVKALQKRWYRCKIYFDICWCIVVIY